MEIKIEKDKMIHQRIGGELEEIKSLELPFHLNDNVIIGDGVTFERIFNLIIENKELFNIIFTSHMGGYLVDQFIEEFSKDADEDNDWMKNMSHCEVYACFDHFKYDNDDEDNDIYYGFHGKGNDSDETNYGFMGSSLNNYKHLPIKIDNNIKFTIDTGGKLLGKNAISFEEKYKTVHSGNFPINLFQFIGAMLYEITWNGTPDERDERFNELKEISDKIDSGEEETYPMEWDDNGDAYLVRKDGSKDYIFGKEGDDG